MSDLFGRGMANEGRARVPASLVGITGRGGIGIGMIQSISATLLRSDMVRRTEKRTSCPGKVFFGNIVNKKR